MFAAIEKFCTGQLANLEDMKLLLGHTKELVKQGFLTRDRVALLKKEVDDYKDYVEEMSLFCSATKKSIVKKLNELKAREKKFREETDMFITTIKNSVD